MYQSTVPNTNRHRSNSEQLFGIRAVIEAIEAGHELDKVLVQKGLQTELSKQLLAMLRETNTVVQYVPVERLNRITRKNHQGVIAYAAAIAYTSLERLIPTLYETGKPPFLLLLDGITDVRNFGAIARTALCAGVDAIIIPSTGSVSVQADAVKTSAGALLSIPVCRERNITYTLKYLKQCGIQIIAATEKAATNYKTLNYTEPVCIVMGAEDTGIPTEHLVLADHNASIPIVGKIGSLNVSVAAGIIIYEALSQRSHE